MVRDTAPRHQAKPAQCKPALRQVSSRDTASARRPRLLSTTRDLVLALKAEIKSAGMTYAQLAAELGMAESSIKRIFSRGDMTLARIDQVLGVLRIDFAELARRVADAHPPRPELTLEQERAVVADRKLLVLAICCLSQWTFEQIVATYALTDAECVQCLVRLDRLGVIELRARNRYRLKVAKGFRWRADGPVMDFFRQQVVGDFYGGGFDGIGEVLTLVHGQLAPAHAAALVERLERVCQDFAQQHLVDQRLAPAGKRAYTLLVGMRSWWFAPLKRLRRVPPDA